MDVAHLPFGLPLPVACGTMGVRLDARLAPVPPGRDLRGPTDEIINPIRLAHACPGLRSASTTSRSHSTPCRPIADHAAFHL
jgi:hypothetical protein